MVHPSRVPETRLGCSYKWVELKGTKFLLAVTNEKLEECKSCHVRGLKRLIYHWNGLSVIRDLPRRSSTCSILQGGPCLLFCASSYYHEVARLSPSEKWNYSLGAQGFDAFQYTGCYCAVSFCAYLGFQLCSQERQAQRVKRMYFFVTTTRAMQSICRGWVAVPAVRFYPIRLAIACTCINCSSLPTSTSPSRRLLLCVASELLAWTKVHHCARGLHRFTAPSYPL
jgi:hypothetical protein